MEDKQKKTQFFQEIFLVTNTAIEIILDILFLAVSKVKINFTNRELNLKTYTLYKILSTTKKVKIIDLKKYTAVALSLHKEAFVMHVAYLRAKISIYSAQKAEIALWLAKKINVSTEYTDFSDVFFTKSAAVLLNRSDINKHVINLEPDKQPHDRLISSLGLVELKTLKIYIKINLANNFIQPSKFPTRAFIFLFESLTEVFVCIKINKV